MPNIEKVKNHEGKTIFPVTVSDAVLMGNGQTLKGKLSELGSEVGINKTYVDGDLSGMYYNQSKNIVYPSNDTINSFIVPMSNGNIIEWGGNVTNITIFSAYPIINSTNGYIKTIEDEGYYIPSVDERYIMFTLAPTNTLIIKQGLKKDIEELEGKAELNEQNIINLSKNLNEAKITINELGSVLKEYRTIDLSDAEQGFYNAGSSVLTFVSNSTFRTKIINVESGQLYKFRSKLGGSSIAAIVMYDSNDNLLHIVEQGSSSREGEEVEGITTIPEGVNKIAYSTKSYEKAYIGLFISYYDFPQIIEKISDNEKGLGEITKTLDDTIKSESLNIWNGNVVDGYINSSGKFQTSSSIAVNKSTDLIPIKPNTYYCLSGRNGDVKTIRCLDENEVSCKVLIASTGLEYEDYYLPDVDGISTVYNGQFKTPSNAAYLQITIGLNKGTYETLMIEEIGNSYVENFTPSKYQPFSEKKIINPDMIPYIPNEEANNALKRKFPLKVLLIGSSHGMNTISQFPWIAYKSGFNVTVGNVYKGSLTLQQVATAIADATSIGGWFKVFKDGSWVTESSTLFDDVVAYTDWDIISIQRSASTDETWTEDQSSALDVIIERIKEKATNTPCIVFNSGFADPNSSQTAQEEVTNTIISSAKEMKEEFQLEIIPVATAIQNARNTSLGNLGNYYSSDIKKNQLCYDSQHLDYGIGCYVAGATLFEFFFRKFGWHVLTAKGYGSYDEVKTFVDALVDSGGDEGSSNAYTEPNSETMKIAKYCAIAAVNNMDVFSSKLAEKYPK